MNEKPVKLNMGFDEALMRLARTPKKAIDAVAKEKLEAQKEAMSVEKLRTVAPTKPTVRKPVKP